MAKEVGSAQVRLIPDFQDFGRRMNTSGTNAGRAFARSMDQSVNDGMGRIRRNVSRVAIGIGAAFASVRVGSFLKGAIQSASDLNESINKSRVVFGSASPAVEKFAKTATSSLGIARGEALESAATLGNLFVSLNLGQGPAAAMSQRMVTLAADLASFNNTSTADAFTALRAGLVGETEPLRRFGINLNEATLKAEALRLGLVKSSGDSAGIALSMQKLAVAQRAHTAAVAAHGQSSRQAQTALQGVTAAENAVTVATQGKIPVLSAAQKAQAAYSLIITQSKTAHGDAARTALEFAGQQKRMDANWVNLKQTIGGIFMPALLVLVTAFNEKLMPAFARLVDEHGPKMQAFFKAAVESFIEIGSNVGPKVVQFLKDLRGGFDGISGGESKGLSGFSEAFRSIGASAKEIAPHLKTIVPQIAEMLATLGSDTISVAAVAIKFLANNMGLLEKSLPFIVAGYVLWKAAQASATLVAIARLPITALEISANLILASALRANAAAMTVSTGATQVGTLATLRHTVATVAAAVAQKAARVAILAWAAAQVILNAVLTANPIGLVIAAIGLLVAGIIIAWRESETFRNVLTTVFSAVGRVVLSVVEIIIGQFQKVAEAASKIPGPIGDAAEKVSEALKKGREKIGEWKTDLENLPKTVKLEGDIKDLEEKLKAARKDLQNPENTKERRAIISANIIDLETKIEKARGIVRDPEIVRNRISTLKGDIRDLDAKIAEGLRQLDDPNITRQRSGKLNADIRPLVKAKTRAQTVLNSLEGKDVAVTAKVRAVGIGVFLPGQSNTPRILRARGGWVTGPGGPTADRIPAMLSNREFVIRAKAAQALERSYGRGFLGVLNQYDKAPDVGGDAARTRIAPPGQRLQFAAGGSVPSVQDWIRTQHRGRYVWGGTASRAADCSGLVGNVYAMLTGRTPFRRYFTTGTVGGAPGLKPGTGTFTIGVTSGIGHMAGNLAGLAFEAASTKRGMFVGSGAKSVAGFARKYTLGGAPGSFAGGEAVTPSMSRAQFSQLLSSLLPTLTRQMVAELNSKLRTRAHGGPVHKGIPYLVGESGPEVFMPHTGGRISARQTAAPMETGATGAPNIRVFIGERELTDIVRVEVATADDISARQLAYRRRG